MHASAFGRKRHRHAAVQEVENSGSHVPPNERFVVTPKALCQLFNTLLDGDPGQDSSPAKMRLVDAVSPARQRSIERSRVTAAAMPPMITGVLSPTTSSDGCSPSPNRQERESKQEEKIA
jgi:hypothetical protein